MNLFKVYWERRKYSPVVGVDGHDLETRLDLHDVVSCNVHRIDRLLRPVAERSPHFRQVPVEFLFPVVKNYWLSIKLNNF